MVQAGHGHNCNFDHKYMMSMFTRLMLRQGLVHLSNLLANRRVDLKYVVEADRNRCTRVAKQLNSTSDRSSKDINILPPRRMLMMTVASRWGGVKDQFSLSASVTFLQPKDLDQGLQDESVEAVLVDLTFSSSARTTAVYQYHALS